MAPPPEALLPNKPLPTSTTLDRHRRRQLVPTLRRLTVLRATPTTTSSLLWASSDHWASANADIQAHLDRTIQIRHPLTVFEPMRHLTFSAPETTAPALCVLACELIGGNDNSRDQAVAAGSALRLIHAAASAHEGLLLSSSARPRTTAGPFGPNIELLAGDGMVPFGFELLARRSDHDSASRVIRVIVESARVAGSSGLVEAQHNEIEDGDDGESDGDEGVHVESWVERVCKKKQGQLHACAGACGAILGGGGEEEIERLRRYGLYVGMMQGIIAAKGVGGGRSPGNGTWLVRKLCAKLALNELEAFDQAKVGPIASLVDVEG